jgi:hypothetical protein
MGGFWPFLFGVLVIVLRHFHANETLSTKHPKRVHPIALNLNFLLNALQGLGYTFLYRGDTLRPVYIRKSLEIKGTQSFLGASKLRTTLRTALS